LLPLPEKDSSPIRSNEIKALSHFRLKQNQINFP
jgi:hypothetical protein